MRKLITIGTITFCLIALNYIIPINFIFDTGRLSTYFFPSDIDPDMDSTVVILNIGNLNDFETAKKIDSVILQNPRSIGLDLCSVGKDSLLRATYDKNPLVTLLTCRADSEFSSSLIEDQNASRFRTDRPDYFEIRLTNSWDKIQKRGSKDELINYKGIGNRFTTIDLKDAASISLTDKIVLIGYLGETVSPDIYLVDLWEVELFQIQQSAFIISTILNDDFITESTFFVEALLIVVAVLLVYFLLTILPIRNSILLTLVAYLLLVLINAGIGGAVFVLFDKGFQLHTCGLTNILIITTLYTCLAKFEKQKTGD